MTTISSLLTTFLLLTFDLVIVNDELNSLGIFILLISIVEFIFNIAKQRLNQLLSTSFEVFFSIIFFHFAESEFLPLGLLLLLSKITEILLKLLTDGYIIIKSLHLLIIQLYEIDILSINLASIYLVTHTTHHPIHHHSLSPSIYFYILYLPPPPPLPLLLSRLLYTLIYKPDNIKYLLITVNNLSPTSNLS